jgi:hypothetical protein
MTSAPAAGVPLGERGNRLVVHKSHPAGRALVEAGDQAVTNARIVQRGQDRLVSLSQRLRVAAELLGGEGGVGEHLEILQLLGRETRPQILDDLCGWDQGRPHVDDRQLCAGHADYGTAG